MTAYSYRALDEQGKMVKGVLEGDSERQVRGQLRTRKLRPVNVQKSEEKTVGNGWRSWFEPTIKAGELALVTRQMATLVQSNLPLDECLRATAEQTRKPRIKSLLLQVRSRVVEGHTLAYALGEFPGVFDELFCAMVKAGEHAGFLGTVLDQLADYTEQRQYTRQKLQMAMIYPFILVGVAVSVVIALMAFVVPKLIDVFAHTQTELPPLTVALIASSDYIREYGVVTLVVLMALAVAWKRALKDPVRRKRWHRVLLRIPVISGFVTAVDTARFATTLSILMASGVPLLEALRIASAVLSNLVLRESGMALAERVQEGSSLHRAMQQSGRFPPMMVHMVASGEASGELEAMLARTATNQERELEMSLGTLSGIFEPLMVVMMGGMVLLIVLAILLPIFDLNTMVR
ncbi:MAG: general secretion pathway protein F [Halieaceae bacterium]|jgi:general secretion pathway protein F